MSKIAVLGVLHNLHHQIPIFSLEKLGEALRKLSPDCFLVELKPSELSDSDHPYKVEYSVILPFAQDKGIHVEAMDPEEPVYSEIADAYQNNQAEFKTRSAVEYSTLSLTAEKFLEYLVEDHWKTLAETQSALTHSLFDLKHRIQESVLGDREKEGWDRMNAHYLEKISSVAASGNHRFLLVTVGIEHVYWLKRELSKQKQFEIIDLDEILK
jgi:hypothetical protein